MMRSEPGDLIRPYRFIANLDQHLLTKMPRHMADSILGERDSFMLQPVFLQIAGRESGERAHAIFALIIDPVQSLL
jgi:hypothetical protein